MVTILSVVTLFQAANDATVSESDMRAALVVARRLAINPPPMLIQKLPDKWIRLTTERKDPLKESTIEFLPSGNGIHLRNTILTSNPESLQSERFSEMLLDSFRRIAATGYRSYAFDVVVRKDSYGWLVIWAKHPLSFHGDRTVGYTNDMVFDADSPPNER